MKLELGVGHRPTPGYEHQDLHPFDHVEHVGYPWMLELPDNSVEEVLALAFIEHLTYDQVRDTLRAMHGFLIPGGQFLFDVPDYPYWASAYLRQVNVTPPYYTDIPDLDWCRRTMFGWQRWPGDEHKSGWDKQLIVEFCTDAGYTFVEFDVAPFIARTFRKRFHNDMDRHLYVIATK